MAPIRSGDESVGKEIFDKITNNDAAGLKSVLLRENIEPDICDENGMTPLQHAAYKGNKEIVQMLLDQGADVNSGKHEYGYTALHFAALSGNSEICHLLLQAGAKSHVTNSVGKTASQMAAFVGNHKCVAVINNHVPKSDIDYYTVNHGLETEPKLPPALVSPLHKFIMQVNVHPVRVALNLLRAPLLYEKLDKVQKVLELMSEKEMKRGFETNEVMAFKFHYLSCVAAEISKCRKRQIAAQEKRIEASESGKKKEVQLHEKVENVGDKGEKKEERKLDPVEIFAKQMLKSGHGENSSPEYQEQFLRECVREFPYRECTVFRQMVANLAPQDSPPAYSVIASTINGQRGFMDAKACCCTCGEEDAPKKCSKCKAVQYCDRECQRIHWFMHKKACARLSQSKDGNETKSQPAEKLATELKNLDL